MAFKRQQITEDLFFSFYEDCLPQLLPVVYQRTNFRQDETLTDFAERVGEVADELIRAAISTVYFIEEKQRDG